MLKVIHILFDSPAVVGIFDLWDCVEVECEYLCLVDDEKDFEIKSITNVDRIQCMGYESVVAYLKEQEYDVAFFHALNQSRYRMLMTVPKDRVIMWSTWGFDIYYSGLKCPAVVPMKIFKPRTEAWSSCLELKVIAYKFYKSIKESGWNLLKGVKTWTEGCFLANGESVQLQKEALRRVDYVSTVLGMAEYDTLRQNPNITAEYFLYKYLGKRKPNVDRMTIDEENLVDFEHADSILLGNSGDPSNNHVDVLRVLKKRKIRMPLYLPMAYSNERYYDKFIRKMVSKMPNKSFIQSDVVSFDEYKKRVKCCRVGVFGHLRQQSIGNISMCIAQGSKVFLYKDGVPYKYFKSQGFVVFSLEDDLSNEAINTPLTRSQIEHNIRLLRSTSFDDVVNSLNQTMKCVALKRKERITLC